MAPRAIVARVDGDTYAVRCDGHAVTVTPEGHSAVSFDTQYLGHGRLVVRQDGTAHMAWAVEDGDTRWVYVDGELTLVEVTAGNDVRRVRSTATDSHPKLSAPMPATVVRLHASVGLRVARGATLLLLEAMKMELPLRAPADAVVTAVHCREGDLVQPNVVLVELDTTLTADTSQS